MVQIKHKRGVQGSKTHFQEASGADYAIHFLAATSEKSAVHIIVRCAHHFPHTYFLVSLDIVCHCVCLDIMCHAFLSLHSV